MKIDSISTGTLVAWTLLMLGLAQFPAISAGQSSSSEHREAEISEVDGGTPITSYYDPTNGAVSGPVPPPQVDYIKNANNVPDFFSKMQSLAFYRDGMWSDPDPLSNRQKVEFAERGAWMMGGHFTSIMNLDSGTSATRSGNSVVDYNAPRFVVGGINQAVGTSGGDQRKRGISVSGRLSLAATAFPADPGALASMRDYLVTDEEVPPKPEDEEIDRTWAFDMPSGWSWRLYALIVVNEGVGNVDQALDFGALDQTTGNFLGPVDGRRYNVRETDMWAPSASVIKKLRSFQSLGYLDNGENGEIDFAFGNRAGVVADLEGSWIHANYTSGYQINRGYLGIGPGDFINLAPIPGGGSCALQSGSSLMDVDENVMWGGNVDDYVALEIESVDQRPGEIQIDARTGILIEDTAYSMAGGLPLAIPELVDPDAPAGGSTERVAGLITRGDNYLCYNEGIVHVRDVLHLPPRTEPVGDFAGEDPTLEAMMQHHGIIQFNLETKTLQFHRVTPEDLVPRTEWVDLAYSDECLVEDASWTSEGGRVDAGFSSCPDSPNCNSLTGTLGELISPVGLEGEYIDFKAPSVFLVDGSDLSSCVLSVEGIRLDYYVDIPSMEAQSVPPLEPHPIIYSAPRVFWRRVGYGIDAIGEIPWEEVEPDDVSLLEETISQREFPPHLEFVNFGIEVDLGNLVDREAEDGHARIEGQIVQVMIMEDNLWVDGARCVGTAFRIGDI